MKSVLKIRRLYSALTETSRARKRKEGWFNYRRHDKVETIDRRVLCYAPRPTDRAAAEEAFLRGGTEGLRLFIAEAFYDAKDARRYLRLIWSREISHSRRSYECEWESAMRRVTAGVELTLALKKS